jgi:large subunit ribosomal protein L7/L12
LFFSSSSLNAVAEKTVLELVELISAFEEKFNVSAAAVAVAAPAITPNGY